MTILSKTIRFYVNCLSDNVVISQSESLVYSVPILNVCSKQCMFSCKVCVGIGFISYLEGKHAELWL